MGVNLKVLEELLKIHSISLHPIQIKLLKGLSYPTMLDHRLKGDRCFRRGC